MAEVDEVVATLATQAPAVELGRRQRLRRHLAEPFFRNAYSLVLNTGVSGVLGLTFWLLAARFYGDADVGRGSVTISLMTLLSGLVALNMTGTLTRFIGSSGRVTHRFVVGAYLLTVVAVTVLAVSFLLTVDMWGPSYAHLGGATAGILFTVTVVAAAISTLQDGVLMGLRRSEWVPITNAVFGVAKIVLLIVLASSFPREGVYLAWVIPMTAILLPVSALIFGRLIPRHCRAVSADAVAVPTRTQVRRFFAADYVGALFLFATVQVVPLMVATNVALHSFGYFYIAWTIGTVLNLVAYNVAASLTVEAAYDVTSINGNCRAAVSRTLGLLLVGAVFIALAAPYGLGSLGRGYLDAAPLLQLLAVAALPTALTEIYLGVLRAQNATRQITQVQVVRGLLVLGAVFLSIQLPSFADVVRSELTRVGLAVLIGQTVVAAWVLPRLRPVVAVDKPVLAVPVPPVDQLVAHLVASPAEVAAGVRGPRPDTVADPATPAAGALSPASRPAWGWPTGLGLLTLAAVACYVVPLSSVSVDGVGGLGLISVLPVASLVGATLLGVSFLGTLALSQPHRVLLGSQVVLAVACLHGLPVVVESMPRFPTAWTHIGFIEYITRTGSTAPGLDGRFSWPGFFGLFAFLTDARDWQDLAWIVRLAPVVSNLLYLVAFALLLKNMSASWRARWLAAGLFVVLNWVGQDYFSPQGLAYFLYLVFLAVLVTWFRPAGRPAERMPRFLRPWIARLAVHLHRPGEVPQQPISRSAQTLLLSFLILLFAVTTASHQLTPFIMTSACIGLVVVGRCAVRGLPALLVLIVVAWISFMADGYWAGHLADLFGGVGQVTSNVSSSVAGRAGESNAEHLRVLHARVALTVGVGALAAIGALRRWRRNFDDRVALVLFVAPAVALGMQSYGGEMALRVYFFALPAACILVAYAVFPGFPAVDRGRRQVAAFLAAVLCVPILLGGFFLARYGNEAFEYVRDGEAAALDYLHDTTSGPVRVVWPTSQPANLPTAAMMYGHRDVDRVTFESMRVYRDPQDVAAVVDGLRAMGPDAYLYTTQSQEAELVLAEGFPAGWGERFRAQMAVTPGVRVVVANDDAVIYAAQVPDPAAGPPRPPSVSASVGSTPLTPVGAACFCALLWTLLVREFRRLRSPWARSSRALTLAALPLAIGFVVVVAERFALLA